MAENSETQIEIAEQVHLDKTRARHLAYSLYMRGYEITQISELVGFSRQAIHRWKTEGNWESLRVAADMSNAAFATDVRWQMAELQKEIRIVTEDLQHCASEEARKAVVDLRSKLFNDQKNITITQKELLNGLDMGLYIEVTDRISKDAAEILADEPEKRKQFLSVLNEVIQREFRRRDG